jgi:hypothetical protein
MEEASFDDLIKDFKKNLMYLKEQSLQKLPLCMDDPGSTKKSCIFAFKWLCQSYLKRIINLAECHLDLVNKNDLLVATVIGRAIMETVANFYFIIREINKFIKHKDFAELFHLLSSYTLGGGEAGIHKNVSNFKLKSIHIMLAIRATEKEFLGFKNSYEWLCEFVHPNGLGTVLSYSKIDKVNRVVKFNAQPEYPSPVSPFLECVEALKIFKINWKESKTIIKNIEKHWVLLTDLHKLYED